MPIINQTRRQFKSRMATKQDVWRAIPALLGDGNGTVEVAGQPGYVYIRVGDGDLGQAFNNRCQLRDNLAVYVGYDPITDPDRRIFQVLTVRMADYAGAGYTPTPNVGPHNTTHYFGGGDDVYVEWRRLMGLRVGRPSAFVVTVDPGIFYSAGAWTEIPSTTVNLTATHAALVGVQAQYVLISLSAAGVVTATAGAAVASIVLLTMADCPSPPAGHIPLAAVRLYKVQTEIDDVPAAPDIVDLRFPTYNTMSGYVTPHDILSASHGDALASAVTRGSLVYGNATPKWAELNLGGASGSFLTRDANDVLWSGFYLTGTPGNTYDLDAVGVPGGLDTHVQFNDGGVFGGSANFTWDDTRLMAQVADAATNTIVYPIRASHITSNTAAAEFGAGVEFFVENAVGTAVIAGRLAVAWHTPAAGSVLSKYEFRGHMNSAGEEYPLLAVLVTPDAGHTGQPDGNARGVGSVDFQLTRSLATHVASGLHSTLLGGIDNTASGNYSVIIGGDTNVAANNDSTIVGSQSCTASANYVAIVGSSGVTVSGASGVAIGGTSSTSSGAYSILIGTNLGDITGDAAIGIGTGPHIGHNGVFMYADYNAEDFTSIAANEFAIRARGGLRHAYDDSNYWQASVSAAGAVTFNATGASAGFTFSDAITLSTLTASTIIYSDASKVVVSLANAAGYLTNDGAGALSWSAAATPSAHNVLDSTYHGDVLTGAITRGDILYGNATPKIARLAKGGANAVLTGDGTDTAWSTFLLSGTAGGKTDFAVTNTKTLTLTATDDYNMTIPATGTAALLGIANAFTDATDATSATTGAITTAGGIGVAKTGWFGTGFTTASGDCSIKTIIGASAATYTLAFLKARGSAGSEAIVVSGDACGAILFRGYDGGAYRTAAQITGSVDGTPGSSDMPGRLVFSTTADGAATVTERMRIDNTGAIIVVGEIRVAGDIGGVASHNTLTGTSNLAANSTGVGTIKFKGATNRDSTGFIKIYIGTTAYYVPVFSAITG